MLGDRSKEIRLLEAGGVKVSSPNGKFSDESKVEYIDSITILKPSGPFLYVAKEWIEKVQCYVEQIDPR